MRDDDSDITDYLGLVVYFVFLLGAVFVGPLEAVLGLGVYWLFESEKQDPTAE